MLSAIVKSLLAKKLRLLSSSVAVLLGVAFMAGTLVLTDTIGRTFDNLFADVYAGTDAYVRSEQSLSSDMGDQRGRIDENLVGTISAAPGVKAAEGKTQGFAQLVDKSDPSKTVTSGGPTFGTNWEEVEQLNPFRLSSGRGPEAANEAVIDKASADAAGYEVGDTARIVTRSGTHEVVVVGIAKFGEADGPAGGSYVFFTDEAVQRLVGETGKVDGVAALADEGTSERQLQRNISAVLPDGVEALTGAEITAENQSSVEQGLSFFNIFLLAFAVIALFVGSFIIYNTFSILVAQRTREMALMRAVGASRRQVLGSVLAEAAITGLVASAAGLVAGIGVASGLKELMAAFGMEVPASGIVVKPATVAASLVTGLGVSIGSAFFPARRAAATPPVAAMRNVAVDGSSRSRTRVATGVGVTLLGAASLIGGLFAGGSNAVAIVGFGAVSVLIGVAVLGPVIARPATQMLGAPLAALNGMTGTLARANATRNPKRTSSTAAALMIGVALVAFITILASSTKASISNTVDQAFVGDFVVTAGASGLSTEVAGRLSGLEEVAEAVGVRSGMVEAGGSLGMLFAVDKSRLEAIADIDVTEGSLSDLGGQHIAVLEEQAAKRGWKVGDSVEVRFTDGSVQELTVAVLYGQDQPVGNMFVDLPVWEANVAEQFDSQVFVNMAEGVNSGQARTAVERAVADNPSAEVQDRTEFKNAQGSQIDQMLNLIYVLLALAVVIALLGIANTLALSIYERTRELGLLRAVGMTQSQLRATVRWESVLIALLGTGLGLIIGVFFGWAIVRALADEGINQLAVPAGQLAVITVIAALAGVLAAIVPARRAARLDVLNAITAV
jgi:putative ABC transport system permease protein